MYTFKKKKHFFVIYYTRHEAKRKEKENFQYHNIFSVKLVFLSELLDFIAVFFVCNAHSRLVSFILEQKTIVQQ